MELFFLMDRLSRLLGAPNAANDSDVARDQSVTRGASGVRLGVGQWITASSIRALVPWRVPAAAVTPHSGHSARKVIRSAVLHSDSRA